MKKMEMLKLLIFFQSLGLIRADYNCICCNAEELEVYQAPSTHSTSIGYIYRFDCLPSAGQPHSNGFWSILYSHQIGYVANSTNLDLKICFGKVPAENSLTTVTATGGKTTLAGTKTAVPTYADTSIRSMSGQPSYPTTSTLRTSNPLTKVSTKPTNRMPLINTGFSTVSLGLSRTMSRHGDKTPTSQPRTTTHIQQTKSSTIVPQIHTGSSTLPLGLTRTTSRHGGKTSNAKPRTTTRVQQTSFQMPMTSSKVSQPTTKNILGTTPAHEITRRLLETSRPSSSQNTIATTGSTTTSGIVTVSSSTAPQYLFNMCPHTFTRDYLAMDVYARSCYQVIGRLGTWSKASSDCHQKGGYLFEVSSAGEEDFIRRLLAKANVNDSIWMGLEDKEQEGRWNWVSGSNVTYTNWETNNQTYLHDLEDCAVFKVQNGGMWRGQQCEIFTYPWICQFSTVQTKPTLPPPTIAHTYSHKYLQSLCPHKQGHKPYGQVHGKSCYQLSHTSGPWHQADKDCKNKGGFLFEVLSEGDQNFIRHMLDRDQVVWMGLTDEREEDVWQWVSGHPVLYTNWADGYWGPDHAIEDCAIFANGRSGKWDTQICGSGFLFGKSPSHKWICQFCEYI